MLGVFQAAGGVEARGELEADLLGAKRGRGLGHFDQSQQAGAAGRVQSFQPGGNEDAVLAG